MTAKARAVIEAAEEVLKMHDEQMFICGVDDIPEVCDKLAALREALHGPAPIAEPPTLEEESAEKEAKREDHDYERRSEL